MSNFSSLAQDNAPLLVAAASDLAPLQASLTKAFAQKTGLQVRFSFGSSGQLASQIRNGAPFDAYLSANVEFVQDLGASGHLFPETVTNYAFGRLALQGRPGLVTSLRDLAKPAIRHLAIANPTHAPYGRAAREVLERQGLWSRIESRVVFAENVRQVSQFVESGNADAGIGAWSLMKDKGGVLLSDTLHEPIRQAGGVVRTTRRPMAARALLELLLAKEGRAVLAQFGFALPPSALEGSKSGDNRKQTPARRPGRRPR